MGVEQQPMSHVATVVWACAAARQEGSAHVRELVDAVALRVASLSQEASIVVTWFHHRFSNLPPCFLCDHNIFTAACRGGAVCFGSSVHCKAGVRFQRLGSEAPGCGPCAVFHHHTAPDAAAADTRNEQIPGMSVYQHQLLVLKVSSRKAPAYESEHIKAAGAGVECKQQQQQQQQQQQLDFRVEQQQRLVSRMRCHCRHLQLLELQLKQQQQPQE
eukprot:1149906-Pelagomonas_calceolata.AAC.1